MTQPKARLVQLQSFALNVFMIDTSYFTKFNSFETKL